MVALDVEPDPEKREFHVTFGDDTKVMPELEGGHLARWRRRYGREVALHLSTRPPFGDSLPGTASEVS